jgi:radical SAM superfamily enzyme YgiQ (UPF0313 family)
MSILFTYYPTFVRFNHGGALLTAICKQAGIKADYVPCTELESKMSDFDVIGFSFVTYMEYEMSKPFIKMAVNAGKKVIAGGGYARRGGVIEGISCICRGEAEDFIVDYLNGNEQAFKPGYVRPTIDGLPFPDLTNVIGSEFHRDQWFLKDKKIIPYQSSRGCFWGLCSFCAINFQEKQVRIKHTIVEDIEFLKKSYSPDLIYLMDTTIPYCIPEWKEQFEKVNIPFQGYIRADIDSMDLEFLIKHGLKATAFGVENPDEDFRNKVLKKGLTNHQLLTTVGTLQKHGVFYVSFFMLGVPGEPSDSRERTGKLISAIKGSPMIGKYEDLSRNIELESVGSEGVQAFEYGKESETTEGEGD